MLPPLGLTLPQAAAMMGLSYQLLYKLRNGRIAISPAMALRLGKLTGMDPHVWLRVQAVYDLATLAPQMAEELETIPTFRPATVSKDHAPVSKQRVRRSGSQVSVAGPASGPIG